MAWPKDSFRCCFLKKSDLQCYLLLPPIRTHFLFWNSSRLSSCSSSDGLKLLTPPPLLDALPVCCSSSSSCSSPACKTFCFCCFYGCNEIPAAWCSACITKPFTLSPPLIFLHWCELLIIWYDQSAFAVLPVLQLHSWHLWNQIISVKNTFYKQSNSKHSDS